MYVSLCSGAWSRVAVTTPERLGPGLQASPCMRPLLPEIGWPNFDETTMPTTGGERGKGELNPTSTWMRPAASASESTLTDVIWGLSWAGRLEIGPLAARAEVGCQALVDRSLARPSCPWLSQMPVVQMLWSAAVLWLTKSTVRPSVFVTSLTLFRHFFWNWASPTASTSSTIRISDSRCAAMAKASRTYMPLE